MLKTLDEVKEGLETSATVDSSDEEEEDEDDIDEKCK